MGINRHTVLNCINQIYNDLFKKDKEIIYDDFEDYYNKNANIELGKIDKKLLILIQNL